MKNLIPSVFLVLFFYQDSIAQCTQSGYFELGGPGIASFNYDRRFKGQDGLGARLGIGIAGLDNDAITYVPIGLNYLVGKNGRHYFEVGGGFTPAFGNTDKENDSAISDSFGHLLIGYRLQPSTGGFSCRVFLCPVFGNGIFVPYYAGLSLGFAF